MPSVGSRVSLRYRLPDSLTDVVGHLEALTPMVVVRTKSGETIRIDPQCVVSVRELSHTPVRNSEIRALAHAAALAWPGTEQQWLDGWLLRFGGGHTSRANSAVPLLFSASLDALPAIADWYAQRGVPPWLALPERLLPVRDAGIKPTRMLVRDIPHIAAGDGVTLAAHPDETWRRIYARDVPAEVLTAVVDGEVTFATESDTAVGRGAVTTAPDGTRWVGVSSVRVLPERRRQGYARAVCAALLAWGAAHGATRAYVEVLDDNAAAGTLYESMDFRLHHRHRYVRADTLVPHA